MTYRVLFAQRAIDDLQQYLLYASQNAPTTAVLWLIRFKAALMTLSTNPERCPLAPESELVEQAIYQYLFGKQSGSFRALFTIEEDRVLILHIRRGSMEKATKAELFG